MESEEGWSPAIGKISINVQKTRTYGGFVYSDFFGFIENKICDLRFESSLPEKRDLFSEEYFQVDFN